jgi:hypothetical protein
MMKFLLEKMGANPEANVSMLDFFLIAMVLHLLMSAPWFITPLVFCWKLICRQEDKCPDSS